MELKKLKLTKRRSDFLQKMNAKTLEDVLRIYPLRYDSRQAVPFSLWKVKDNVKEPVDLSFHSVGGGVYIYTIEITLANL